ncbi:MAG: hypothetical protein KME26_33220, partial [Oscillatoria princeps RMCB-10]|nr:hypothetical protein [Oscillatoria princeps RMCB-10]
ARNPVSGGGTGRETWFLLKGDLHVGLTYRKKPGFWWRHGARNLVSPQGRLTCRAYLPQETRFLVAARGEKPGFSSRETYILGLLTARNPVSKLRLSRRNN